MDLDRLIKQHGFELHRQKKHKVYKDDAGRTFVRASTPSDCRSDANSLTQFARLVGVPRQELLRPRRPKRTHTPLEALEPMPSPTAIPEFYPSKVEEAALSKADLKRLRRWEKHYAEKGAKLAKLQPHIESLMHYVTLRAKLFNIDATGVFHAVEYLLKKEGRQVTYAAITVDGGKEFYIVMKVGPLYLDLPACLVRTETKWTFEGKVVEVVGEVTYEDVQELAERELADRQSRAK